MRESRCPEDDPHDAPVPVGGLQGVDGVPTAGQEGEHRVQEPSNFDLVNVGYFFLVPFLFLVVSTEGAIRSPVLFSGLAASWRGVIFKVEVSAFCFEGNLFDDWHMGTVL